MRSIGIMKAPLSLVRPGSTWAAPLTSPSKGAVGGDENVFPAASSATSTTLLDPPLDFSEELAGDCCFATGRCKEGDWDAMCDRLLIACQIGNDRVKGKVAEMFSELGSVADLVVPSLLETRDKITKKP